MNPLTRSAWLLAVVLLVHLSVSPASAQSQTTYSEQVGGPGGGVFNDACKPGDVLVGVNITYGKAINSVGPVCRRLGGALYGLRTWGVAAEPTGGPFEAFSAGGDLRCPPNTAVARIHAGVDKYGIVSSIELYCRPASGGAIVAGNSLFSEGKASTSGDAKCPGDFVAIGMTGGYGALVDRVGLKCGLFTQADAPAEKPINAPAPGPGSAGVQHEIACQYYAMNAKKEADANRRRSCGGTGARWSLNIDDHMAWCRSQHGDMRIPDQEAKARSDALAACGSRGGTGDNGAGGGGQTLSVVAGNTMYDTYKQPNKDICYLRPGDTLTMLPPDGNAGKWLRLSGNSGNCSGKTGYVWNDGELK
ncbi:MAG: hypothetical protein GY844_28180 [Bradyrhizobium sp.]|nr:hypothetical protein [Bradyrhizobium sp.]